MSDAPDPPICAEHAYEEWVTFHRAPTGPFPAHTAFMLLLCPRCGAWTCFPWTNYILCTPAFRQTLERLANEAGRYVLERQEQPPLGRST